ncbi:MAG: basic amino acid/polyamine antiporter, family [Bacillota bacterium]|jgi:APA family basic amino acid/polyamine antiporter|nr:basic amino acid/polyamine antiporter, family [Bacillota bacterium]
METSKLTRTLGMKEGITITTGTVVGVGIFTVGANCVGILGSSVIIYTLIAMIICIFPAMMYAEMGAMLPYAGGTYEYAKRAINKPIANIAAWHYIIAIIAACASEALAFSNYFSWILSGLGIDITIDTRMIAFILMAFFIAINFRGIKMSSRWQNGFVAFFWAASSIWMFYMFRNVDLGNFIPSQFAEIPGFRDAVLLITYLWWCFAGFETVVGMGGEIKFPQINIPRTLLLSPLLIFSVSALFQYFLIGVVPTDLIGLIAEAEAPYAQGLQMAGYVGFPLVFLCVAIAFGGDLSTMNPGIAAPSRYIFQMGSDHVLPEIFGKVHKDFKTPFVAVLFVGMIAFMLILTNSIVIIAEISICSLFWCYIIGFFSFLSLRKRETELKRPYKMPFGIFGAVISIVIYAIMMLNLGARYFALSCIITAVCLLFYYFYSRKHSLSGEELRSIRDAEAGELEEDRPSEKERAGMDREFKAWRRIVAALFLFTIGIYLFSFVQ